MSTAAFDLHPPLGLNHLLRLKALLAATVRTPSEYSLANLYLFRERHHYRMVDCDWPYVLGRSYDGEHHAMPLGPLDVGIAQRMLLEAECIFPLGEAEAHALARDGDLLADHHEADADYIYSSARLAGLTGAKAKKAQAASFARLSPTVVPFAAAEAHKVLSIWLDQAARGGDYADARECDKAIDQREALELSGVGVLLGREPVGFLLAGPIRDGEQTVHFAKARRDLPGVYAWMFAQFAQSTGAVRLNFEQDLGNPGLAQAKRALSPVAQRNKFRVRKRT